MKKKVTLKPVSIRLSPVIYGSLSSIAENQGESVSEVIRQFISDALDNRQKQEHYIAISEKIDALAADTSAIRSVIERL